MGGGEIGIVIERETEADFPAIDRVVTAAFDRGAERDLVRRLREDGDMAISLVARQDGEVVGHVAFSQMTAPLPAVGLAPLSVVLAAQRLGIGSALVRAGLEAARRGGWEVAFVLGEPAYYERFGFSAEAAAPFASPYAGPYFLALALSDGALDGRAGPVAYAPAFDALA
ncbi:GNAT family N-acetyltransferase [Acuticoccus mangrovi]|uniref:N-acetyltransferase n=1 Tax=Acuticoccus mangrovi TaxID=2796142 RepID=A0A934IN01_9HYPH|nr:N-acetyltransferase [Acuticoccus mangrovi]MBJ3774369.1 N-acetyltransferase [Acuticoccus mangrovi]